MRIIHTSDWHLGRQFGPVSLESDQQRFADWFVELASDQRADLVVIAGDIYDRAIAPTTAIELFNDTVGRLLGTGAVVAAISGNHDGANRVAPYDELMDRSGFYLRGGYQGTGEVIRHEFADGALDLVLVPFLDPQGAPDDFGVDTLEPAGHVGPESHCESTLLERRHRRTHQSVLEDALGHIAPQLGAPRSLAVAHAFVTGGEPSESERQLVIGGTGEVSATIFKDYSYVALGHLHRSQTVAAPHLRYSGTPLAYSFSEDHEKSVTIIDMDPAGTVVTSTIPVGVGRSVRTITGEMDQLLDPGFAPDATDCFVRAVITDRETILDAKARLTTIYPHIVEVRLRAHHSFPEIDGPPAGTAPLSPLSAAKEFWVAAEGEDPSDDVIELLADAITHAQEVAAGTP